ncbi:MAG: 23S rRNA (uridine(2552)-2'-O)-methyltransferase RlmE [Gammaproteobacteria bacterium]|nr:23S rRNA (uridine(2552)-2'-O)-methyltransferase RlmE [Gammaproteobacteria bacterium]
MARSKSSERWLREHFGDAFVRQAQALGLRSRAAFKLLEIDQRDRLLRPGQTVVDLGAAPGGWAQVAADKVGPGGRVVALDLLPIEPLPGVTVLQGDFTEQAVLDRLLGELDGRPVDLVLSDMAPNMSGMKAVDQPRSALLAELALDCARQVLRPKGDLLLKMFQGEGFDPLLAELRAAFSKVVVRKPKASRPRSREVYLLARNYRLV